MCIFCKKEVLYDIYPRHAKFCQDYKTVCEQCKLFINYNEQDKHAEECGQRLVECLYCKLTMKQEERHTHEETCSQEKRRCNKCLKMFPRKFLNSHDCDMPADDSFSIMVSQMRCPICLLDCGKIKAIEVYATRCGHICCQSCLIGIGFQHAFQSNFSTLRSSFRRVLSCPVCRIELRDDDKSLIR